MRARARRDGTRSRSCPALCPVGWADHTSRGSSCSAHRGVQSTSVPGSAVTAGPRPGRAPRRRSRRRGRRAAPAAGARARPGRRSSRAAVSLASVMCPPLSLVTSDVDAVLDHQRPLLVDGERSTGEDDGGAAGQRRVRRVDRAGRRSARSARRTRRAPAGRW